MVPFHKILGDVWGRRDFCYYTLNLSPDIIIFLFSYILASTSAHLLFSYLRVDSATAQGESERISKHTEDSNRNV